MKGIVIRDLFESFARQHSDRKVANRAFTDKVMGLVKDKKLSVHDFSFKELWEGLVASQGLEESASSTAFPTIAGEIISSVMIAGYDQYPKIGDSLVRTVPSKQKISQVAGWTTIGKLSRSSEVREKEDYPNVAPPDEKTIQIKNRKNGLKIHLTKEAIFFDKTGELLVQAAGVGAELARWKEEVILCTAIDADATAYNLGDMFVAGNSNYLSGAGSALGTTGFEACHIAFRKKTDDKGRKINILPDKPILMYGADLEPTVFKLLNNEYGPTGSVKGNDKNFALNKFVPVYNPYISSTTAWYYGDFKNSLRWEEVWPLETFSRLGPDTDDGFDKDIIAQYKASIYGGCGYDDYRRVYENAGA
jgi:hypothetical protein